MATILLLAQGIPMITAGDEFGRSQQGNNNAWCQDNQVSWIDWTLARKNKDLLRFFRLCIDLRKKHPVFRREEFFRHHESGPETGHAPEITWQYLEPGQPDWAPDCHGLAFLLHGRRPDMIRDDDFFIMINGSRGETCVSPSPTSREIPSSVSGSRSSIPPLPHRMTLSTTVPTLRSMAATVSPYSPSLSWYCDPMP